MSGPLEDMNKLVKQIEASAPVVECPTCHGDVPLIFPPDDNHPTLARCRSCHHRIGLVSVDFDLDDVTLAGRLVQFAVSVRHRLSSS